MHTKAAIVRRIGAPYEIVELDLDPPKNSEVLLRFEAAGLCHSDVHIADGDLVARLPMVGGHEGAGVVEEIGPGVTRVAVGDHVVCSFTPSCGTCRYCSTGRQNLCVLGANAMIGCLPDNTFRFHAGGEDYGGTCMLGTFSQRATVPQESVVRIDPWLPLRTAALAGCGVPTGWGAAVYAGNVRAGDITVVYGVGGIGINAVKGASMAGAAHVIAVDPVLFKRDMAKRFGATETFTTAAEAKERVTELSWGQGADQAILAPGIVEAELVSAAVDTIGEGGTVVIVGLAKSDQLNIALSGNKLALADKTIRGALFGSCNPQSDIVRLLRLYNSGHLPLDELTTRTYPLEEINTAVADLRAGRNIRGVLTFEE